MRASVPDDNYPNPAEATEVQGEYDLTQGSFLLHSRPASAASFLTHCAVPAAHVDAGLRLQRALQDLQILQRLACILHEVATLYGAPLPSPKILSGSYARNRFSHFDTLLHALTQETCARIVGSVQSFFSKGTLQVIKLHLGVCVGGHAAHLWSKCKVEVGHKHGHSRGHIHACQLLAQAVPNACTKRVEAPRLHMQASVYGLSLLPSRPKQSRLSPTDP